VHRYQGEHQRLIPLCQLEALLSKSTATHNCQQVLFSCYLCWQRGTTHTRPRHAMLLYAGNVVLPTLARGMPCCSMLATWYYPHSPVACHAALCWQHGTTHTRPRHAMLLCARAAINRYLLQAALWPMLRQTDGGQTDAYTLLCILCEQCQ